MLCFHGMRHIGVLPLAYIIMMYASYSAKRD